MVLRDIEIRLIAMRSHNYLEVVLLLLVLFLLFLLSLLLLLLMLFCMLLLLLLSCGVVVNICPSGTSVGPFLCQTQLHLNCSLGLSLDGVVTKFLASLMGFLQNFYCFVFVYWYKM